MKRIDSFLALLATGFLIGPLTAQAQYDYQQIGYPGQAQSNAWGINDSGDVLATGFDPDDSIPFVYASLNGAITDVAPAVGYSSTSLLGINDAGAMVGSVNSLDLSTRSGAIRSKDGEYTIFNHPDALSETSARGISNNGLVVGVRDGADVESLAGFIYDPKTDTFTDIDTGPALLTIAHGINSKGEVVGDSRYLPENDPCGSGAQGLARYGWLRKKDGSILYFQVNGLRTVARGINDAGLIVGQTADPSSFELKGFVVKRPKTNCESITVGAADLLQFPGALQTFPEGINNSGDVVGIAFDLDDSQHGFIATEQ